MNRAKLIPEEVKYIILVSTMTTPEEAVTVESELAARKLEGFLDVGWHFLIGVNGRAAIGVPVDERGSMVARYSRDSIVVKVVGGRNLQGEPTNTLTASQAWTLAMLNRRLIASHYPEAQPTLYRELFKGVNPCFTHEDY